MSDIPTSAPSLDERWLYLDLEFGRDGRFHAASALRGRRELVWEQTPFGTVHAELLELADPSVVLVGHNLKRFDLLRIEERLPNSPLLHLPALDTLELSVVAWPSRPYHALVKDERLVRDARPNPLSDVRASRRLLGDGLEALAQLGPSVLGTLAGLLRHIEQPPTHLAGWRALLARLGCALDAQDKPDLREAWVGRVCTHNAEAAPDALDLGHVMIDAWLRGASTQDGSVLPAWVRHAWPATAHRLRALRATRCGLADCAWCTTATSPEYWLSEVFGFPGFRDQPSTEDGRSLQRVLVEQGLSGTSTFGILPTGGGKSLCFQVPAEARHRLLGQLTVVISPLQSLMKDQVDGLRNRIGHARAIYSGLPALERPTVMEEVRSGACGLLYLSPEQFRNQGTLRLLAQRELGAIVFDEAHCLSQWGHDFRTDYPYVLKAVAELCEGQGVRMPPVFLFTATAQFDATREILAHVQERTGETPVLFDGGSARDNLDYRVEQVPEANRLDRLCELLAEHIGSGAAIVFCGSRRRTEELAAELTGNRWPAVAYHAGLDASARRELQDAFLQGEHRIITATNAFGMGVDKENVRLVVHWDMPSSLEAYLQEAGRAGRDRRPATAVLLWSPGDAEARFALGSLGDIDPEDLKQLWRGIKQLPASRVGDRERRVATARELLFLEQLQGRFDPYDDGEETRVKAAVNWLERAGVLERRENRTLVFTGSPQPPTLAEAIDRVAELDLPPAKANQWNRVLAELYAAGDDGVSADQLAVLANELSPDRPTDGGKRVLEILRQLTERRLVTAGQTFTAFVTYGVQNPSKDRLERWGAWETRLFELLEEEGVVEDTMHLPALASMLTEPDRPCTPEQVARLLRTWTRAGAGLGLAGEGIRYWQRHDLSGRLRLEVSHETARGWLRTRRELAALALEQLVALLEGTGKDVLVSCQLETLVAAVESDLRFRGLGQPVEATREALVWLHDLRIITVQNGLAVFYSAMNLDRAPSAAHLNSRSFNDAGRDLLRHQQHKVLRVHVIDEWARQMLAHPQQAERLRSDWFSQPLSAFRRKWFPDRETEVERPTTQQSYDRIVASLGDPDQQRVVEYPLGENALLVAGPGSGKTRVLVHRVAWLLRCQRARARQILVVCYTRANALELRRRLATLVGRDGTRVQVRTLHSVALSMVGARRLERGGDLRLDTCLDEAARMLRGETLAEDEQIRRREELLRGIEYLFVDEYQDIDGPKYELLSALVGRAMPKGHRRLQIFAVGDDDQAIFGWDGASSDFIRSFERDYRATRIVLRSNYRNPRAVLELAQALVEDLPGRLKAGVTLDVDRKRVHDPPAGPFASAHPDLAGRIPWSLHTSVRSAATAAVAAAHSWVEQGVTAQRVAILTRTWKHGLFRLRTAAEAAGLAFSWPLGAGTQLPVGRVREVALITEFLESSDVAHLPGHRLMAQVAELPGGAWRDALADWVSPNVHRTLAPRHWRHDLHLWTREEQQSRAIGEGVHLGTLHSAKGLEFDHVILLDDGTMGADAEDLRLLYVGLTRARLSLQLFSSVEPSPAFRALRHPLLARRTPADIAADGPADHRYSVITPDHVWLDWLGRQPLGHPAVRAMAEARHGDPFRLELRGNSIAVVRNQDGLQVGALSAKGREEWSPRMGRGLRLRLLATLREYAADREPPYRGLLQHEVWGSGVWEARWRASEGQR